MYRVSQKKWWQDFTWHLASLYAYYVDRLPSKILPPFFLGHPVDAIQLEVLTFIVNLCFFDFVEMFNNNLVNLRKLVK